MNREIKFRAWDGKDMVYCPFSPYNNDTVDINEQFRCLQVNGLKLMQFTGLHDKNGKEIFEGDIVQELERGLEGEDCLGTYEIVYGENGFWPKDRDDNEYGFTDEGDTEFEVIGNIYENPDLLK